MGWGGGMGSGGWVRLDVVGSQALFEAFKSLVPPGGAPSPATGTT